MTIHMEGFDIELDLRAELEAIMEWERRNYEAALEAHLQELERAGAIPTRQPAGKPGSMMDQCAGKPHLLASRFHCAMAKAQREAWKSARLSQSVLP